MLLCFYLPFMPPNVFCSATTRRSLHSSCYSYHNEGKKTMITQTFKRWLNSLFAWWPWRTSTSANYAESANSVRWNTTPESMRSATANGEAPSISLPGTTSIAIEQSMETDNSTTLTTPATSTPKKTGKLESLSTNAAEQEEPSPADRHLLFLHYLVQRGVYNEGFQTEQIPEQYKGKEQPR